MSNQKTPDLPREPQDFGPCKVCSGEVQRVDGMCWDCLTSPGIDHCASCGEADPFQCEC